MAKTFTQDELKQLNKRENLHLLIHGKGKPLDSSWPPFGACARWSPTNAARPTFRSLSLKGGD